MKRRKGIKDDSSYHLSTIDFLISKAKSLFFLNTNKIDKPLARLVMENGGHKKIRNVKGYITKTDKKM